MEEGSSVKDYDLKQIEFEAVPDEDIPLMIKKMLIKVINSVEIGERI